MNYNALIGVAVGFTLACGHLNAATDTLEIDSGFGTDENASSSDHLDLAGKFTAEPQVATGKFTTAIEIRPMMDATRGNWMGVREYDGNDLVYSGQTVAFRCGLVGVYFAINGGELQEWKLPPCHHDLAWPNSILAEDLPVHETYPLKSVKTVSVTVIYDDLTTDSEHYERSDIKIP